MVPSGTSTGTVRSLCGWCVPVVHSLLSCGCLFSQLISTMTGTKEACAVVLMTGIVRGWCAGSVAHPLLSCGCLVVQLISTMTGTKEACAVALMTGTVRSLCGGSDDRDS